MTGVVHGGQSAIQGATVKLYHTDPTATTYGAPGIFIGSAVTDVNGNFLIASSSYSGTGSAANSTNCPAGTQAYITAAGGYQSGQPSAVNNNMLQIAALGNCSTVSSTTSVVLNELTTVAAAYALSGFTTTSADGSTGYYKANISAPVANSTSTSSITATTPAGLAHAFINATNLVSNSTGTANTSITASTAGTTTTGAVPTTELNTLGDMMQACIDSTSSTGSLSTSCSTLFGFTPSISGVAPTNTLQAFVNLARNPYPSAAAMNSTTGLLSLVSGSSAFQPTLTSSSVPTDWSVVVVYNNGLPAPYWVALDQNDTIYLGRSTTSSTTSALFGISPYGVSVPLFASPSAGSASRGIAPDALGNIWLCDNGTAVDRFSTSSGALLSTYTTGGSCTPVAVDKQNNMWVGHVASGSGSMVVDEALYNSTAGTWAQNYTVAAPAANFGAYGISLDANQNIWVAGYYSSGTTEYVLSNLNTPSSPSYAASGTAITPIYTTVGSKPYSTAIDASGNGWVAITGSNSVGTTGLQKVTPNTTTTPTSLAAGSLIAPTTLNAAAVQQIAIDGAGTIFIPDNNGAGTQGIHIYSTVSSGTVLSPPTALRGTPDSISTCSYVAGAGYSSAPTAIISGGGGTGAAITLTINTTTGAINGCSITSGGAGYITAPTVTLSGGGTPTTAGSVTVGVLSIYNPRQVVIDSTGSAWAGYTLGGAVQVIGIAAPSYPLLSVGMPGLSPGLTAVNPLP